MPLRVAPAGIEAEPHLADFLLVKQSRLSVVPVSGENWRVICQRGGYAG